MYHTVCMLVVKKDKQVGQQGKTRKAHGEEGSTFIRLIRIFLCMYHSGIYACISRVARVTLCVCLCVCMCVLCKHSIRECA